MIKTFKISILRAIHFTFVYHVFCILSLSQKSYKFLKNVNLPLNGVKLELKELQGRKCLPVIFLKYLLFSLECGGGSLNKNWLFINLAFKKSLYIKVLKKIKHYFLELFMPKCSLKYSPVLMLDMFSGSPN